MMFLQNFTNDKHVRKSPIFARNILEIFAISKIDIAWMPSPLNEASEDTPEKRVKDVQMMMLVQVQFMPLNEVSEYMPEKRVVRDVKMMFCAYSSSKIAYIPGQVQCNARVHVQQREQREG